MREIKFRAWEKQLKEMIPVEEINFSAGMINQNGAWRMLTEVALMQYTGLKDKNGVEIFEGDIIAHEVNNMSGAVVWNPASYCYSIDSLDGSEYIADLCDYDWNPEVIGNIYENKDLLK